jgi:hypothetical protein
MKFKNKVFGTIFGVLASSLVFIAVPISAQAGECTATDPCMTYAEVDGSGSVVNVIVCQPSVCSQQLGGIHPNTGNRLVPQVAANPLTNDTHGTSGQMSKPEENKNVTLSNDNVYTVTKNNTVVEKIVVPEIETTLSGSVTTSMGYTSETATVKINENSEETKEIEIITVNAEQITRSNTQNNTTTTNSVTVINETLVLTERKTEQEVNFIIDSRGYVVMKSKVAMLTRLLLNWFL